jgi:tRNA A37 N6-isopentenylltransferase MiaA
MDHEAHEEYAKEWATKGAKNIQKNEPQKTRRIFKIIDHEGHEGHEVDKEKIKLRW